MKSHVHRFLEPLEQRIVFSGLTGTNLKKFSFSDSDGDKVDVTLTGGKDATFDITLDGGESNNADVDNISINGLDPSAVLTVKVTPVKYAGPTTGVSEQVWTDGFVNINSITSSATGSMRAVRLDSANVLDINMPGVDLSGGLSLSTSSVQKSDRLNSRLAGASGLVTFYQNSGEVDFNNISLKSAGEISIRGTIAEKPINPGDGGNDFIGAIQVAGNVSRGIYGTLSNLNGSLEIGGDLNDVRVNNINSLLDVKGNLKLSIGENGFDGTADVGGDVHLFVAGGGLSGQITAGGTISGVNTKLTNDKITINGGLDGALISESSIAAINFLGKSPVKGSLIASGQEGSIGDLFFQGGTASIANVASNLGIGKISSSSTLAGSFTTAGSIGDISVRVLSPDIDGIAGVFTADGNIGKITSSVSTGNAINGAIFFSIDIGDVNAQVQNVLGKDGIRDSFFSARGNIGTVTVDNSSLARGTGKGTGINHSEFSADGSIAASGLIDVKALGNYGIFDSKFTADANQDDVGNVGNIRVSIKDSNQGNLVTIDAVSNSEFSGQQIGNITVSQNSRASFNAIYQTNFYSDNGIGDVKVTHYGIGGMFEDATNREGTAVYKSNFYADFDVDGTGTLKSAEITLGDNGQRDKNDNVYASHESLFSGATIGAVTLNLDNRFSSGGLLTGGITATNGIGQVTVNGLTRGTAIQGANETTPIIDADSDANGVGTLAGLKIELNDNDDIGKDKFLSSRGLAYSKISAAFIGDVSIELKSDNASHAFDHAHIIAETLRDQSTIGNITAITHSVLGNAIESSEFKANLRLGNPASGLIQAQTYGAIAINQSTFQAAAQSSGSGGGSSSIAAIKAENFGLSDDPLVKDKQQAIVNSSIDYSVVIGAIDATVTNVASKFDSITGLQVGTNVAFTIGQVTVNGTTNSAASSISFSKFGEPSTSRFAGIKTSSSATDITINGNSLQLDLIDVDRNFSLAANATGVNKLTTFDVSGQILKAGQIGGGTGSVTNTIKVGSSTVVGTGVQFIFDLATYSGSPIGIIGTTNVTTVPTTVGQVRIQ